MTKDPICVMTVDEASALCAERDGQTFYFCSDHCRQRSCQRRRTRNPGQSLAAAVSLLLPRMSTATVESSAANPIYTCLMHPEVQQNHPGDCPKCGMTLVPKTPTASPDQAENAELHDMTKRFWIGAELTLPVFVLAMAHLIPALANQSWADSHTSRWMQFALTTPAQRFQTASSISRLALFHHH